MSLVSRNSTVGLTIAPGFEAMLRANAIDTLDSLFAIPNDQALSKPGLEPWRERLRLRLRENDADVTFYLKRFRDPPARAMREVRRSGSGAKSVAGIEWTWMQRLAEDGIGCTKPVAFGEEIIDGHERRSAVLMAEVPGRSLESWVTEGGAGVGPTVRENLESLAEFIRRFHAAGYVHRDLYLSHIFFDPTSQPGDRFRLIDLQRVMKPEGTHRRWIVKDLAALNYSVPAGVASTADRIRWLKRHLGLDELDDSARRWVYRVVGKTQRIARHDRRRTARLETQPSAVDSK